MYLMIAANITFAPITPNKTGMICQCMPYNGGYIISVHTPPIHTLQSYNGFFNHDTRRNAGLSNNPSSLYRKPPKIMPSSIETWTAVIISAMMMICSSIFVCFVCFGGSNSPERSICRTDEKSISYCPKSPIVAQRCRAMFWRVCCLHPTWRFRNRKSAVCNALRQWWCQTFQNSCS